VSAMHPDKPRERGEIRGDIEWRWSNHGDK